MTEAYDGPGLLVNSGPLDGLLHNGEKGRKNPAIAAVIGPLRSAAGPCPDRARAPAGGSWSSWALAATATPASGPAWGRRLRGAPTSSC